MKPSPTHIWAGIMISLYMLFSYLTNSIYFLLLLSEHIMSAPEENFEEHDLTGELGDSQFQEKGCNDDTGVGAVGKRWPGWPGETVFRILVPAEKIGGIIGRKGEFIKKMCEESRARIKILDGPPGLTEKVVSCFWQSS